MFCNERQSRCRALASIVYLAVTMNITNRYVLVCGWPISHAIFLKKYRDRQSDVRDADIVFFGILSAIFISSWLVHFSIFFKMKTIEHQYLILVEGLHKLSAKLRNKRPRYRARSTKRRLVRQHRNIQLVNWYLFGDFYQLIVGSFLILSF